MVHHRTFRKRSARKRGRSDQLFDQIRRWTAEGADLWPGEETAGSLMDPEADPDAVTAPAKEEPDH